MQIIQGAAENRFVQYRADALFFIVNYELTVRDLSVISETLKPDLVILDEAQRIKNWRTKIASTIKLIPSRYVFVLSGTPLKIALKIYTVCCKSLMRGYWGPCGDACWNFT